jgi:hypothetical protein
VSISGEGRVLEFGVLGELFPNQLLIIPLEGQCESTSSYTHLWPLPGPSVISVLPKLLLNA